jgi:thymidine phosphorylase
MSNDEIKELIQLVVESGIAELECSAARIAFAFAGRSNKR